MSHDPICHPDHYTWIDGIECLDVAKWFPYCSGCAIKYIWRAGRKGTEDDALNDLRKAIFYLNREIEQHLLLKGTQKIVTPTVLDGK